MFIIISFAMGWIIGNMLFESQPKIKESVAIIAVIIFFREMFPRK